MSKFYVLVDVEFAHPIPVVDQPDTVAGFYAARSVEALNPDDAKEAAIRMVILEMAKQFVDIPVASDAHITIDEYAEMDDDYSLVNKGFLFYPKN